MNRLKMPSNKKNVYTRWLSTLETHKNDGGCWLQISCPTNNGSSKLVVRWVPQRFKFTEEGIRQWVDGLYSMGQQTARAYWLTIYQQLYIPLVNVSVRLAIEGGWSQNTLVSLCGVTVFSRMDRLLDFSVWCGSIYRGSRYRRCWEPFARNITVCFSSNS